MIMVAVFLGVIIQSCPLNPFGFFIFQYGGDITRKMKLLKRQAEGKKKLRKIGNIEIPKDAFIKVLKTQPNK